MPASTSKSPIRPPATLAAGVATAMLIAALRLACTPARRTRAGSADRGDVPGWVLVTVMTAGLVIALWAAAQPALSTMFQTALDSVKGPGG